MVTYLLIVTTVLVMLALFYRLELTLTPIDVTQQKSFANASEVAWYYPLEDFAGVEAGGENDKQVDIYGTLEKIDRPLNLVQIRLAIPEYLRKSLDDPNVIAKNVNPEIIEINLTNNTVFFDPWDNNRPKTFNWINLKQPGLLSIFLNTYVHIKAEVGKDGQLIAKEFSISVIQ